MATLRANKPFQVSVSVDPDIFTDPGPHKFVEDFNKEEQSKYKQQFRQSRKILLHREHNTNPEGFIIPGTIQHVATVDS